MMTMGCLSSFGWCDEWGWVLHFHGGNVGDEVVLGIFCVPYAGFSHFYIFKEAFMKTSTKTVSMP